MPRLDQIAFGAPQECDVTFDREGGHLWRPVSGEAKPADAVHVKYNPGYRCQDYLEELAAVNADPTRAGIVFQFTKAVLEWDLCDAAGKRLPITEDGLRAVGFPIVAGVIAAIDEDMAPSKSGD